MRIVLASASPRRRELMKQIIPEFEVIPSGGEEIVTKTSPGEAAMELASQKADIVAGELSNPFSSSARDEDLLVIGADTVVAHRGRILGKPRDEEDAFCMLRSLAGDTHQVCTGVCLIRLPGQEVSLFYEETSVEFYPMSEEEIRAYIATGDPMDKAGAYGIQSGAGKYIRGICGDYNNVVGLPVARLYHELGKIGSNKNQI